MWLVGVLFVLADVGMCCASGRGHHSQRGSYGQQALPGAQAGYYQYGQQPYSIMQQPAYAAPVVPQSMQQQPLYYGYPQQQPGMPSYVQPPVVQSLEYSEYEYDPATAAQWYAWDVQQTRYVKNNQVCVLLTQGQQKSIVKVPDALCIMVTDEQYPQYTCHITPLDRLSNAKDFTGTEMLVMSYGKPFYVYAVSYSDNTIHFYYFAQQSIDCGCGKQNSILEQYAYEIGLFQYKDECLISLDETIEVHRPSQQSVVLSQAAAVSSEPTHAAAVVQVPTPAHEKTFDGLVNNLFKKLTLQSSTQSVVSAIAPVSVVPGVNTVVSPAAPSENIVPQSVVAEVPTVVLSAEKQVSVSEPVTKTATTITFGDFPSLQEASQVPKNYQVPQASSTNTQVVSSDTVQEAPKVAPVVSKPVVVKETAAQKRQREEKEKKEEQIRKAAEKAKADALAAKKVQEEKDAKLLEQQKAKQAKVDAAAAAKEKARAEQKKKEQGKLQEKNLPVASSTQSVPVQQQASVIVAQQESAPVLMSPVSPVQGNNDKAKQLSDEFNSLYESGDCAGFVAKLHAKATKNAGVVSPHSQRVLLLQGCIAGDKKLWEQVVALGGEASSEYQLAQILLTLRACGLNTEAFPCRQPQYDALLAEFPEWQKETVRMALLFEKIKKHSDFAEQSKQKEIAPMESGPEAWKVQFGTFCRRFNTTLQDIQRVAEKEQRVKERAAQEAARKQRNQEEYQSEQAKIASEIDTVVDAVQAQGIDVDVDNDESLDSVIAQIVNSNLVLMRQTMGELFASCSLDIAKRPYQVDKIAKKLLAAYEQQTKTQQKPAVTSHDFNMLRGVLLDNEAVFAGAKCEDELLLVRMKRATESERLGMVTKELQRVWRDSSKNIRIYKDFLKCTVAFLQRRLNPQDCSEESGLRNAAGNINKQRLTLDQLLEKVRGVGPSLAATVAAQIGHQSAQGRAQSTQAQKIAFSLEMLKNTQVITSIDDVDACIPGIISSDYELMREMMLQLFASGSLDSQERKAQTVELIEKIKKAYKESEKQPTVKKDVFEAVIEQVTACETRFTESMLLTMESMSNAECVASCIQERDKAWAQFEAAGAKPVDKLYAYFLTYVVQSLCIRFNLKEDEQVIKIDRLDLTGENAGSILAAKVVKAVAAHLGAESPSKRPTPDNKNVQRGVAGVIQKLTHTSAYGNPISLLDNSILHLMNSRPVDQNLVSALVVLVCARPCDTLTLLHTMDHFDALLNKYPMDITQESVGKRIGILNWVLLSISAYLQSSETSQRLSPDHREVLKSIWDKIEFEQKTIQRLLLSILTHECVDRKQAMKAIQSARDGIGAEQGLVPTQKKRLLEICDLCNKALLGKREFQVDSSDSSSSAVSSSSSSSSVMASTAPYRSIVSLSPRIERVDLTDLDDGDHEAITARIREVIQAIEQETGLKKPFVITDENNSQYFLLDYSEPSSSSSSSATAAVQSDKKASKEDKIVAAQRELLQRLPLDEIPGAINLITVLDDSHVTSMTEAILNPHMLPVGDTQGMYKHMMDTLGLLIAKEKDNLFSRRNCLRLIKTTAREYIDRQASGITPGQKEFLDYVYRCIKMECEIMERLADVKSGNGKEKITKEIENIEFGINHPGNQMVQSQQERILKMCNDRKTSLLKKK